MWPDVLDERHLTRVLREYQHYYNQVRPHLSLNRNSSVPRGVDGEEHGGQAPDFRGIHERPPYPKQTHARVAAAPLCDRSRGLKAEV